MKKVSSKKLKKLARARREVRALETKTREFARNTKQAAEFIAETVRAESRHLAHRTVTKLTNRLIGQPYESPRRGHHDPSLEPFGGDLGHH